MKKYIMAFDQGTTSSRTIIFNNKCQIVGRAQKEFRQIYPKPGWVEHDPEDIWDTQIWSAKEAIKNAGIEAKDIAAIGITNQRETTIVWDKKDGKPVYNAIVWQCRRTAPTCDILKKQRLSEKIRDITGLIPDAYFSGTKIKWILDNVENARERVDEGRVIFGNVDSFLIWRLTGGRVHATDYTNASRTMLYNIHDLKWDECMLDLLGIPCGMLPDVKPSSCIFGMTDKSIFGTEIPIAGVAGDQQAALFGQACFNCGDIKNTYGTGCFMLMNTGEKPVKSKNGLLTTIAYGVGGQVKYALEGSVFIGGAVVQWLRDELRMIRSPQETEDIAMKVPDSNGVYIVPAFVGLGAPYWDMYARGTIVGLTRGAKKEHIVRAALESIAYQSYDVMKAMEQDSGIKLTEIKVDGGASANNFLMQFQADILNYCVKRSKIIETTILGAAYLAGLAVGYFKDMDEISGKNTIERKFIPKMQDGEREKLLDGWHKAVARTLS